MYAIMTAMNSSFNSTTSTRRSSDICEETPAAHKLAVIECTGVQHSPPIDYPISPQTHPAARAVRQVPCGSMAHHSRWLMKRTPAHAEPHATPLIVTTVVPIAHLLLRTDILHPVQTGSTAPQICCCLPAPQQGPRTQLQRLHRMHTQSSPAHGTCVLSPP